MYALGVLVGFTTSVAPLTRLESYLLRKFTETDSLHHVIRTESNTVGRIVDCDQQDAASLVYLNRDTGQFVTLCISPSALINVVPRGEPPAVEPQYVQTRGTSGVKRR